jgi:carbamoylphosphate synthase large subunit
MNKQKRILITGVGGPTPRSFAHSLRKYSQYKDWYLVGTDSNPYALGLYMNTLFDSTYRVPKAADPGYWDAINEIVRKERIEVAVILPEREVLEWARKAGEQDLPCLAHLPDHSLALRLFDKAAMTAILEPHGLAPRSFTIQPEELQKNSDLKIDFPFWIRSASGSSGLGSLKVENMAELRNWMHINPGVAHFLASEYLPGRNLGCKMLYHEGELLRSAIAERVYYIMSNVAPSGVTGNTSFGRLVNDPRVFRVARDAMEILFEEIGAPRHGFFTVDLKEDKDGKPMVTEVNLRFVAFTQCYAAGGANLPEDYIRLLYKDQSFDRTFKLYEFEPDMIFLRDVDEQPIIMKESQLLQ